MDERGLTLQLRPNSRNEGSQAFAQALVDIGIARRNAQQKLQYKGQGGFYKAAEHGAARISNQGQRMEGPDLHHWRGRVLGQS